MQSQEVVCGGRYLSGDDPMRVFAAGNLTNEMRIEVIWRNGRSSTINGVRANRLYEIDEQGATEPPPEGRVRTSDVAPLFEDVSSLINHTYHEEEFNDYERQPLLPKKLSQSGPGVAWVDVDGDGWDDLVIGSGKGGKLAIFRNNEKGGFERLQRQAWDEIVSQDQSGIVGTRQWILAGSANYEDGLTNRGCVRAYEAQSNVVLDPFPGQQSSTGPLALADLAGDGSLALFVGGRVIPGRYPEPASSLLFRFRQGRWELDTENTKQLARLGLVSGAVWSDLNGDGFPELIVACEWGPVRIFKNTHGLLSPWDVPLLFPSSSAVRASDAGPQPATLNELHGWWNGVTTGDFDGDGRMDIVAGNWGLNSRYRTTRQHPCKIYYGDITDRKSVDLIEAYYDEEMKTEVPERDFKAVAALLPFVRSKFSSYAAYAQASLSDIYGDKLRVLKQVKATTLETMIFLNRGDQFEAMALPTEAQFSPAFAVCVGDMDGDGNEDIFLSQNFFATQPETSRLDAGRGLWLAGDGHGHFQPVPGQRSGVRIYGEQRGAALADYDHDGRVDLVVTQNGAATKLYHNVGAKPGLRVRLVGPPGNPLGIGAQLRLQGNGWQGPTRELHAGSGYWSQDSSVQILSGTQAATGLWIRWPGGKIVTPALPLQAKEIEVDQSGAIRVLR